MTTPSRLDVIGKLGFPVKLCCGVGIIWTAVSSQEFRQPGPHTKLHTKKSPMGLWEEWAVSVARWRLFSAICELAEGTSCLVLPPDMNRPQRTCHKKIPDFPSLLWMIYGTYSWLIYALHAWAWAETHHNRVNPQGFFLPTRIRHAGVCFILFWCKRSTGAHESVGHVP